jgi:hypothetical protein
MSPNCFSVVFLFSPSPGSSRRLPLLSMLWTVQAPQSVQLSTENTATRRLIRAAAVWKVIQVVSSIVQSAILLQSQYVLLTSLLSTLLYVGVIGDSNVKCRNMSSKADLAGVIGSSCNVGSDCLYGECTSNVCSAPLQKCPSVNGESQERSLSQFVSLLYSTLLYSTLGFSSFSSVLIFSFSPVLI